MLVRRMIEFWDGVFIFCFVLIFVGIVKIIVKFLF